MYCFECMREKGTAAICPHCHKPTSSQHDPSRLAPGTRLQNGKYLLGSCLGQGGFGITYIGLDVSLNLRVAIKEYFPRNLSFRSADSPKVFSSQNDDTRAYEKGKDDFLSEAKRLAQFDNIDGVAGVKGYFLENNTAYIVMPYLEGEDLRQYISGHGVFPPQDIFARMFPVMDALSVMHHSGVLHRDISPDNIMYLKSGKLKLMDFGAARNYQGFDNRMTVYYKRSYAPVEQLSETGNQGSWTDVYGLCATIYYCMTGKSPEPAINRLSQDSLLPPSRLGIAIPPGLETVLMRGLAVRAENRIQSMDELKRLTLNVLNRSVSQKQDDPFATAAANDILPPQPAYTQARSDNTSRPAAAPPQAPVTLGDGFSQFNDTTREETATPAQAVLSNRRKKTALIAGITAAAVVLLLGAIAVAVSMSRTALKAVIPSAPTTAAESVAPTAAQSTQPATAPPATEPPTEEPTTAKRFDYDCVLDTTHSLTDEEISELEDMIYQTNLSTDVADIKLKLEVFDSSQYNNYYSVDTYAREERKKETEHGIVYIAFDIYDKDFSVACDDFSSFYISSDIIANIDNSTKIYRNEADAYNFCRTAIEQIPSIDEKFPSVEGSQQVLFFDSYNATSGSPRLTLVDYSDNKPRLLLKYSSGVSCGSYMSTESDLAYDTTRSGIFPLSRAYSTHAIDTGLDWEYINKDSVLITDPQSKYYNTIQNSADPPDDKDWTTENSFTSYSNLSPLTIILIGYNGNGTKSSADSELGKCQFIIDGYINTRHRAGDIDVDDYMDDILLALDKEKNPYIVIR